MVLTTYSAGARGEILKDFQAGLEARLGRRLVGGRDGKYGEDTTRAVIQVAAQATGADRVRIINERAGHGHAGPSLWNYIGVAWPDLFARCLMLTAAFEGTGFDGSCGPAQTTDTAGVTFGIIGFTSGNGELQELLRAAVAENFAECQHIAGEVMTGEMWARLQIVIRSKIDTDFEAWGLDMNGSVRPALKRFLEALGDLPWFRRLQMERAHKNYWKRAEAQTKALMGEQATDRAYALMFDIAVQNGGLKQQELDDLIWHFSRNQDLLESDRMYAVTTKVIERLRNKGQKSNIIEDVRSRKTCICKGTGRVHGEDFTVKAWAL